MSAGFHTVHVRVNDAATGQPTPCRVRFTGPDGTYYAPFGRQVDFAPWRCENVGGNLYLERWGTGSRDSQEVDAREYAFIDGTCEIRLPGGKIHVEVHKGPEYEPLDQEIDQPPGKMALRLTLKRWTDLRARGWYSGDARCHMLTPHAALLEGAAEDVAVVNLLAQELVFSEEGPSSGRRRLYTATPNLLAFSGQRPAVEMPGHMVVVNTQNYHGPAGDEVGPAGHLGSLSLLNCHRVVYPLCFGPRKVLRGRRHKPKGWPDWPDEYEMKGWDDWTLAAWCDQCHRKGGLVVWSDVVWGEAGLPTTGEGLADLILGKVDAFEIKPYSARDDDDPDDFDYWYLLLNCGFPVPLVGASGKSSNEELLGVVRTYARLPEGEPFTYRNWIEAVRAGRTFVTFGPLLTFTVNGQEAGAVVQLPQAGAVHVRAEARSLEPFESLDLILNGEVLQTVSPTGSPLTAVLEQEVTVSENGWLAARCRYPCKNERSLVMRELDSVAHSSPVYVRIEGTPLRADPRAAAMLDTALKELLEWVRDDARCETEQQRENLAAIFRAAREKLALRVKGC